MKIWYVLLLFSFGVIAEETKFKNCEPNLCELLLAQLSQGVPQYTGQIDTGKSLLIASNKISTIGQSGSLFKVWSYGSGYYDVRYKCFQNAPCLFIWLGVRTVH